MNERKKIIVVIVSACLMAMPTRALFEGWLNGAGQQVAGGAGPKLVQSAMKSGVELLEPGKEGDKFVQAFVRACKRHAAGEMDTNEWAKWVEKAFSPGSRGQRGLDAIAESAVRAFEKVVNGPRQALLNQWEKNVIISAVVLTLAYQAAKMGWWYGQQKVQKPRVFIEWCQRGPWARLFNFCQGRAPASVERFVVPDVLKERVKKIVSDIKAMFPRTCKQPFDFSHRALCIHSSCWRDATACARMIARKSGLDFAVVPTSSFFALDAGLKAVDELFAWIECHRRPVCIIFEQADLFLADRSTMDPTTSLYQLIAHFQTRLARVSRHCLCIATLGNHVIFDKGIAHYFNGVVDLDVLA